MPQELIIEDDFIVGGNLNARIAPNFRLRELKNAQGRIYAHLELISVLQILRNYYARPVNVIQIGSNGKSAVVNAANIERLQQATQHINEKNLFKSIQPKDIGLFLEINAPDSLPDIALADALETAFSVTSAFETSGDRFQQVTGNFDGAGLSFGPAQWNFGSNTLGPLLRKFHDTGPTLFRSCFSDFDDYLEILELLDMPTSKQVGWGNNISTGRSNANVIEPWKSYFKSLGRVEVFKSVMVSEALRKYGAKALKEIGYLESLAERIRITGLREVCSIYDLVIQQGSLSKAKANIEHRVAQERPGNETLLVQIAVEERGKKAKPEYRADCISRRLGILNGQPVAVANKERTNQNFYLLRKVRIKDPESASSQAVGTLLASVGDRIASGEALFA